MTAAVVDGRAGRVVESEELRPGVRRIVLRRPDVLNAMNADLVGQLHAALAEAERNRFFAAAVPVIGSLMRERGAVLVLDPRTVLMSAEAIDMTDAAIARLTALEILRKTRDDEDSYTVSPVINAVMTASVIAELQQQFELLLSGGASPDRDEQETALDG